MIIEKRHDETEFPLPSWIVDIDFQNAIIQCSLRTNKFKNNISIKAYFNCSDSWWPIKEWETKLMQLNTKYLGQDESFSYFSHHPRYKIICGERTQYYYYEQILNIFIDKECRIPLRFILKRLQALKKC